MGELLRLRSDSFDAHGGASKGERLLAEPILVEVLNETRNNANIQTFSSGAGSGGSASETLTVTGLKAGDEILSVSQRIAGGGVGKTVIGWTTVANDALTVQWDADPGAGAIVVVTARRATS